MEQTVAYRKPKKGLARSKRSKMLFYALFISIPVIHFFVFYVYINFNSIIMAFQKFEVTSVGVQSSWVGFDNFKTAWDAMWQGGGYRMLNSLLFFGCEIFISLPLAILASYYIYKKKIFSGFFKVMLFMPQILSAVILGTLFKYVSGNVLAYISENWFNKPMSEYLLDGLSTQTITMIVFNTLMSFGVNVLLYTNAMSGISQSIIESGKIDGVSTMKELFHIVIPLIYPTITSLVVISICYMFTNQFQVYTIYEAGGNSLANMGYFIYMESKDGNLFGTGSHLSYPVVAAMGLILTAIVLPLSLAARYLFNRFGPSEN